MFEKLNATKKNTQEGIIKQYFHLKLISAINCINGKGKKAARQAGRSYTNRKTERQTDR